MISAREALERLREGNRRFVDDVHAGEIPSNRTRRIELACQSDVAFRVITANVQPDHTTIARFRRRHVEALKGLFVQTLRLCAEAGLVRVGLVALDGTKIAGVASLDSNRSRSFIEDTVEKMFGAA